MSCTALARVCVQFQQPAGDAAGRHPSPGVLRPALDLGLSGWPKPGDPSLAVLAGVCGGRTHDDPSGPRLMSGGHPGEGGGDSIAAGRLHSLSDPFRD